MPRGKSDNVNFKPYDQSQIELIPRTADELIPHDHMVRVVDRVIDSLDVEPLMRQYMKGGGRSRFSPMMLLKVLVYGYMTGVCSSRRVAKALRENIYFMWLSGRQQPDFRTINTFRKDRLAPVIDEVFIASVKLLADAGYVSLSTFFVDGTKVEANAGRYTFVWKKAMDKNEARLDAQLREYLSEARRIADEEDLEYGDRDLEEMGNGPIDDEFVKRAAAELSSILAQLDKKKDPDGREVKKKTEDHGQAGHEGLHSEKGEVRDGQADLPWEE